MTYYLPSLVSIFKQMSVIILLIIFSTCAALCYAGTPTIAFSPASWTKFPVAQGAKADVVFLVTTGSSFQGNVTMSVTGLPSGVTGSWKSNPITPVSNTASPELILTASAAADLGQTQISVIASGSGATLVRNYWLSVEPGPGVNVSLSHSKLSMTSMGSTTLIVTASAIGGVTIPSDGSGASAKVVSGLPSGVTQSWSDPSVTVSTVQWTLTITGSPTAIASSSTLSISAKVTDSNSGNSYSTSQGIPLTVSFTKPTLSFTLPAQWAKLPVKQGGRATTAFTVSTGGSFHGSVTLTVSGLPNGVTGSWSSNPFTPSSGVGSSTLTLTASPTATTNYFQFTVDAMGDGLDIVGTYAVLVEPAIGEAVTISQSALTIYSPGSATLSVSSAPLDGIQVATDGSGTSAKITSSLPAGITATWSKPAVNLADTVSWTLTLKADDSAEIACDPLDVTVQISDANTGTTYSVTQTFNLLVELLASVDIGDTPGKKIRSTFMGLSHEWGDAQSMMGYSAKGTNMIYRQLLANLNSYGSGRINLRIGGNTTDTTGEPTSTTVTPIAELALATGSHIELGVNLGSGNVGLATDQATAYLKQMPADSVAAIEIGNEPDWYPLNGLRPSTYSINDYYDDFNTWKDHIMPVLPDGVKLMGASWAVTSTLSNIDTFQSLYSDALGLSSQHFYASNPSANPAKDFLLAPDASTAGPSQVAAAVSTSHSYGVSFRIGELGAVSGGGVHGICDAFGSALWAIDTMFEFANVGVDGVNWEASSSNYNHPFTFNRTSSNGIHMYTVGSIYPLYYGLLFFQAATEKNSQLLLTTLSTPANIKTWATIPGSGDPHLVIINKDETLSGTVAVNLSGYSHASIYRLTAPSYTSSTGITFAGQTFDGSTDGTIQGTQSVETIQPTNGIFHLQMPVTSAALVIFSND